MFSTLLTHLCQYKITSCFGGLDIFRYLRYCVVWRCRAFFILLFLKQKRVFMKTTCSPGDPPVTSKMSKARRHPPPPKQPTRIKLLYVQVFWLEVSRRIWGISLIRTQPCYRFRRAGRILRLVFIRSFFSPEICGTCAFWWVMILSQIRHFLSKQLRTLAASLSKWAAWETTRLLGAATFRRAEQPMQMAANMCIMWHGSKQLQSIVRVWNCLSWTHLRCFHVVFTYPIAMAWSNLSDRENNPGQHGAFGRHVSS